MTTVPPVANVTILLASPPGLGELALNTAIKAISGTKIVATASDIEAVLRETAQRRPDVLLIDSYYYRGYRAELLTRAKEMLPGMLRVVLVTLATQEKALLEAGADYVLELRNLHHQLPSILDGIRADRSDGEHASDHSDGS